MLLEIRNLSVAIGISQQTVHAVRQVSFNLAAGEILAIVGESGCGKSILCKSIMGLLPSAGQITGGTISFEDRNLTHQDENAWEKIRGKEIAMITQNPMTALNPMVCIGEQIAEAIMLHHGTDRHEAKKKAIALMHKVHITEPEKRYNQYPHQFSGGMQQRVVIAIALSCEPKILIADEPTTALDLTIQAEILQLMKEIQRDSKISIVFVTHDFGVVATIADRVAVMYAGEIVEIGTLADVFYHPCAPYTWALLSALPTMEDGDDVLTCIEGIPPDLTDPPVGDAFAARNKYALAIDFIEAPPLFKISETHYAKTWLMDPRAPRIEPPIKVVGGKIVRQKEMAHENQHAYHN
jgi:oligopeptide transport system ATP-binding protein